VVYKSLSPVWDDSCFEFRGVAEGAEIVLTMFDKDKGSRDDPMGVVRVSLSEMDGQERAYALQVRVPISYLV
jgi:hypothetical protein